MPSVKIPNGSGGWIKIPTVKGDAGTITSVVLTSGNHAAGTTDTYTITYNDNSTTTFTVYNGADGSSAGDMVKSVYDPNAKNADAFSMANMVEGTTNKILTATERTKLDGIATGATANSADTTLLARANHTGTQLKATISDFPTEMTPSSHTHGNITNDGKVGSTADLMLATTTAGAVTTKSVADVLTLLGLSGVAKIETTSYTGTGTGGSANPKSVTFTGTPHIVFIRGGSEGELGIFLPQSLTTSYANYSYAYIASTVAGTVGHFAQKSSDGKTLYWYNTYNANSSAEQFNENSATYTVVAVTL